MKETIAEKVAQLIRPEIRALAAYHVPDARGLTKLDAMENPYTWPPEIVDAWLARLRDAPLNRYPDPAAHALCARLKASMGVPEGCDVLLGNGSDELIQIIALALSSPGRMMLAPEPGFSMYRMIAIFAAMEYVGIPLRADFTLDRAAMLRAIEQHQPAVVFLAYPNNPTGNLFDDDSVRAVIEAAPGLVVLDEAYHVFANRSWMSQLPQHPNLLVMRTLSKMGLAGLRLGLLAGHPQWLNEFNKIRLPYNINVLTQLSAAFALEHADLLEQQAARIRTGREQLVRDMQSLPGITVYPSQANFVLFRTAHGAATGVFEALKHAGILIKNLHGSSSALEDCLRVTVGTPQENAGFLTALRAALPHRP